MGDPDLVLLDRWSAGDQDAGGQLFKHHFAALYRFFEHKTRGEVDDLVQETFLACVRNRASFARQSSFRTYLFAIARHVLFKHWRGVAAARTTLDVEDVSIESLSTSLGGRMAQREDRARLRAVLRTLPMGQQVLLEMFYWQGFDRDQLAEIFDVEPATIGSRLFRAREALQAALADDAAAPRGDALDAWARGLSDDR